MRYPKRPRSSVGDEMVENGDIRRIGSNRLCGSQVTLLDHQAWGLCAICHHSRPFRRQWTIPAVLGISYLPSLRLANKIFCQRSKFWSRVSSRDLDAISSQCIRDTTHLGDCVRVARQELVYLEPPPRNNTRRLSNPHIRTTWDRTVTIKWGVLVSFNAKYWYQYFAQTR